MCEGILTIEPAGEVASTDTVEDYSKEPWKAPVGSVVKARDLMTSARRYDVAPGEDAVALSYRLFKTEFEAQGFYSPTDLGTVVIGETPEMDMWAVGQEHAVSDDAPFVRVG